MKKYSLLLLTGMLSFFITNKIHAQPDGSSPSIISGQDGNRVITTAVPFLMIAPDARAGAMGDVGVATSPDANSVHWNNGKLAFIEGSDIGFSVSYSPWLKNLAGDMSLAYLTGYYKIDRLQTVGVGMRYFDMGSIQFTDVNQQPLGTGNPRETAVDATYSRLLSEKFSIGVSGRFIHSNLASGSSTTNMDARAGVSVAADIGTYYHTNLPLGGQEAHLAFGAAITNIGSKLTYTNESQRDFIPTNLRIGSALTTNLDPYNTLTFALDFNKLMVPTTPIYERDEHGAIKVNPDGSRAIASGRDPDRPLLSGMFGSFFDAPGGLREELAEITIGAALEYWYNKLFAARAGYFHESAIKGNRKYMSMGLGFRYQVFGIDFAYLVPFQQQHPMAETLRFTMLFNFNQGRTQDMP
jgi:hypothetical protein